VLVGSSGDVRVAVAWRLCTTSLTGPSHEKAGQPNQDAVGAVAAGPRSSDMRFVAVADGHGERAYFRSDRGADFAVEAGLMACREFFLAGSPPDADAAARWAAETQAGDIVSRWRASVAADVAADPFTAQELTPLQAVGNPRHLAVALDPMRPYGATLLGAAVGGDCIVFYQIGDGDIVTVSQTGIVCQPLGEEAQAFSNVTSSLCDCDPLAAWRTAIHRERVHQTAFILLCSDGYSGAFEDRDAFLAAVQAMARVWREGGSEKLRATLDQSVQKARTFTGDDTTVAVLYRVEELAT
jgi:serine/threonine protein phosphatase PrpC